MKVFIENYLEIFFHWIFFSMAINFFLMKIALQLVLLFYDEYFSFDFLVFYFITISLNNSFKFLLLDYASIMLFELLLFMFNKVSNIKNIKILFCSTLDLSAIQTTIQMIIIIDIIILILNTFSLFSIF